MCEKSENRKEGYDVDGRHAQNDETAGGPKQWKDEMSACLTALEKKELDRKTNLHGLMKAETQPRSARPPPWRDKLRIKGESVNANQKNTDGNKEPLNPSLPECIYLPFFKHKYKDKETEETIFHDQYNNQETYDYETPEANEYEFRFVDNLNASIISDFLNSLTPKNMNVASLGLSGTDEDDLFGDLEEFERTRYDVRSSVSEHMKIKVNVELTLASEHKKITSTFVIEGTQTVENEEHEETIKELSKNESRILCWQMTRQTSRTWKPVDTFCCQRAK